MGPHSDMLHSLFRDYRERKKIMLNMEHWLMLQVGWAGKMVGEGEEWMRMSERVVWTMWLCKQGSVCTCMCVCLCVHACMRLECLCARMHVCMSEDSVALVRMLDSPFAGSVATVVFPWRHCHLLLH